jgi:hypothetical protein
MREAPTAESSGAPQRRPALGFPVRTHHDTARISLAPMKPSRELPGWFWGALGCFTVLGVGLVVLFLVLRPDTPSVESAASRQASAAAAAAVPTIQVVPLPTPEAPAAAPSVPVKVRGPRALRVARYGGGHRPVPGADQGKAADSSSDEEAAMEEELLRPRKAASRDDSNPSAQNGADDN